MEQWQKLVSMENRKKRGNGLTVSVNGNYIKCEFEVAGQAGRAGLAGQAGQAGQAVPDKLYTDKKREDARRCDYRKPLA